MKKRNLRDSLFETGLIEHGNANDIKQFKKNHRKEYARDYNKDYSSKTTRKTLIFTPHEFEFLQEQADCKDMKLSPFLKACIFSAINETYIFPDAQQLTNIEQLLQDMQNRITETIMYIHMSDRIGISDIQQLKSKIKSLEVYMEQILRRPPNLDQFIHSQVAQDKYFLQKLMRTISSYLIISDNDH